MGIQKGTIILTMNVHMCVGLGETLHPLEPKPRGHCRLKVSVEGEISS